MNDIEKTLVELDAHINENIVKEKDTYDKYQDIIKRRENAQKRVSKNEKKLKNLRNEFINLKTKCVSFITIPVLSFVLVLASFIFNAPFALSVMALIFGVVGGLTLAESVSCFGNESDERFIMRLFPSVRRKQEEINKLCSEHDKLVTKVSELRKEEDTLGEEYEELSDGIVKLKEIQSSVLDLHIKNLRRELLPYYTELEDVIAKTIKNPPQFYTNICNGLNHKERREILESISGKSCENCTNSSCKLNEEEKENISECKDWYNEVEIGMSKVLRR